MSVESMNESTSVEAFEEHRPLLISVTYRMLGSLAEAEDVVQEPGCVGTGPIKRRSPTPAPFSCA